MYLSVHVQDGIARLERESGDISKEHSMLKKSVLDFITETRAIHDKEVQVVRRRHDSLIDFFEEFEDLL